MVCEGNLRFSLVGKGKLSFSVLVWKNTFNLFYLEVSYPLIW